jgi:hypothetical protein
MSHGDERKGGVRVNLCRTYRRRDFCNSGSKEPQDTLTNRKHVTRLSITMNEIPPVSKGVVQHRTYRFRCRASEAIQQAS